MNAPVARPRLLHVMLRVKDLAQSIVFYCDLLGMRINRRLDFQQGRFSLVYLGYDDDRSATVVELTWNWDRSEAYVQGDAYGHIAIAVGDLTDFCGRLQSAGAKVVSPPGEMGKTGIHVAFIEDPDGYRIELIQEPYPLADMTTHVCF